MNTAGVPDLAPVVSPSPSLSAAPTPFDICVMLADAPSVYQSIGFIRRLPGGMSALEWQIEDLKVRSFGRYWRLLPSVYRPFAVGSMPTRTCQPPMLSLRVIARAR